MKPETEAKLNYVGWGLILGAAGAMLIGFTWGGWTTRGTSQQTTEAAVLTARSAICAAQFVQAPNHQRRLKELKAVNSWERAAYIETGGWDKMPAEEKAGTAVSRACAEGLALLADKSP